MSFSRYEVRIDGDHQDVIWGPGHDLVRARETARKAATDFQTSIRIDELVYQRVGDPYPEADPIEFYDPPEHRSAHDRTLQPCFTPEYAKAREALDEWRNPAKSRHGELRQSATGNPEVRYIHNLGAGQRLEWTEEFKP